jgi:hypothetical protein
MTTRTAELVEFAIDMARPMDDEALEVWGAAEKACTDIVRLVRSGTATTEQMKMARETACDVAELCSQSVDKTGCAKYLIPDATYTDADALADTIRSVRSACYAAAYATFPDHISVTKSAAASVATRARAKSKGRTWAAAQHFYTSADLSARELLS